MSIKHLRVQAGGYPARGPHPDLANPTPSHDSGNEFPDEPSEHDEGRPQDQPDLDAFAARMGTDKLADRTEQSTSSSDAEDSKASNETDEASAWRSRTVSALDGMATGAKRLAGGLGSLAEKVTPSTDPQPLDLAALRRRVDGIRTVMVTTADESGSLSSRPLTVQTVSSDGDVMFVIDRDADWAHPPMGSANVAFVDSATWVSVAGEAVIHEDTALLDDLWNPLLDGFFPDGRASAVVLEVRADRWEYWTAPNKLTQLVEIVSAKFTDHEPDLGDSGTVET